MCFPALLENDVPFHIHEVHEYWNDVGSLAELRQGTFDALRGELRLEIEGEEVSPGVIVARRASPLREDTEIEGPAWIGRDVTIGARRAADGADRARRRREHRRWRAAAQSIVFPRHRDRPPSRS